MSRKNKKLKKSQEVQIAIKPVDSDGLKYTGKGDEPLLIDGKEFIPMATVELGVAPRSSISIDDGVLYEDSTNCDPCDIPDYKVGEIEAIEDELCCDLPEPNKSMIDLILQGPILPKKGQSKKELKAIANYNARVLDMVRELFASTLFDKRDSYISRELVRKIASTVETDPNKLCVLGSIDTEKIIDKAVADKMEKMWNAPIEVFKVSDMISTDVSSLGAIKSLDGSGPCTPEQVKTLMDKVDQELDRNKSD